jgi:hypothetical protein
VVRDSDAREVIEESLASVVADVAPFDMLGRVEYDLRGADVRLQHDKDGRMHHETRAQYSVIQREIMSTRC